MRRPNRSRRRDLDARLSPSACRMRCAGRFRIVHRHVQAAAEHGHIQHARSTSSSARMVSSSSAVSSCSRLCAVRPLLQLRRRAQRDHLAAVHQRQAVAVFGFVHVMGADENGVAGRGKVADQRPRSCRARWGPRRRSARPETASADRAGWRSPAPAAASSRRRACASGPRAAPSRFGHFEHVVLALRAPLARRRRTCR